MRDVDSSRFTKSFSSDIFDGLSSRKPTRRSFYLFVAQNFGILTLFRAIDDDARRLELAQLLCDVQTIVLSFLYDRHRGDRRYLSIEHAHKQLDSCSKIGLLRWTMLNIFVIRFIFDCLHRICIFHAKINACTNSVLLDGRWWRLQPCLTVDSSNGVSKMNGSLTKQDVERSHGSKTNTLRTG